MPVKRKVHVSEAVSSKRAKAPVRSFWQTTVTFYRLEVVLAVCALLLLIAIIVRPEARSRFIEAENLNQLSRSSQFATRMQYMGPFSKGGTWTNNSQLYIGTLNSGDWIEFGLPARKAGNYQIILSLTASFDCGIVSVLINDTPVGQPINLYLPNVGIKQVVFDSVALAKGENRLRFEVIGHDPEAKMPYYQFGLDGVLITRM